MKKISKVKKLIIVLVLLLIIALVTLFSRKFFNNNIAIEEYEATTANAGSSLIARYIQEGITIGGITGTLKSLDTSDATATAEDLSYGKTAYARGEKITGTNRSIESLKIGDYVSYTPDTANVYTIDVADVPYIGGDNTIEQNKNLKWRVMSVGTNQIEIVSTTSISAENISVNEGLYAVGFMAYNNIVYTLNDICYKHYSNKSLGAVGRSINLDDIELKMNGSGIAARNAYKSNNQYQYNHTYDASDLRFYNYYPILYEQEVGAGINSSTVNTSGIGKSEQSEPIVEHPTEQTKYASSLTITQTAYTMSTNTSQFTNTTFYDMIFNGEKFWLASRSVNAQNLQSDTYAEFGAFCIDGTKIDVAGLYSLQSDMGKTYKFRPVVTLTNLKIQSGNGSSTSPYVLSK